MSESMYPAPSRELAARRCELAPDIQAAFGAFSQHVFADGALSTRMKPVDRRGDGPCDAMPLLHKGPHQSRPSSRSDPAGAHGGDLGCRGDAGGRRLRPYRYLVDYIGGGTAARPDVKGVEAGL
jgi:hypothetical protein